MKQLLEFRTVPIDFEFRVRHAKFEMRSPQSSVDITRSRGKLQVETRSPRLQLDTYDSRKSIGLMTASDSIRESRDKGIQAAYDATANFAEEGNMLMDIQYGGSPLADIAASRSADRLDTQLGFSPAVPVDISWEPGSISLQYDRDRLFFDWRINAEPDMQFTPGGLEYTVNEYPRLEITYTGRPLYVPPSSDPEYTPTPYDRLV